ncbi:SDR family oxidoreductase [Eudoraea chungangensis]|uniref:SDR family oxidoreductase n=1 Tax=Eudoraea chungangensis TaxID=1481905 RepID=UPI0023ED0983|nr:SDR family oxidoreductase [Eudoraea chungangensis]
MSKTIGIIGCGWLGLPLAKVLIKEGYNVHGSTTSKYKLNELSKEGIKPYLLVLQTESIIGAMDEFIATIDILILNVPPKMRAENAPSFYKRMQLLQEKIPQKKQLQILFVSSISVYGNVQGIITEDTVPQPISSSGIELLASEKLFQNRFGDKISIVRFGGLIGDKRHPVKQLSGRTGLKNGNDPVNLIHLDDCIRVIQYLLQNNIWGHIINAVYPIHPPKNEYYDTQAKKRGLSPPIYDENQGDINGKIVISKYFPINNVVFKTDINE